MKFGVRDSLALGALLNTRGLVELVALNVGLDLGILSPALFSMMVVMALATTLMTVPALKLISRGPPVQSEFPQT
jgi:Kef-type K+ transport system membrane component KefB